MLNELELLQYKHLTLLRALQEKNAKAEFDGEKWDVSFAHMRLKSDANWHITAWVPPAPDSTNTATTIAITPERVDVYYGSPLCGVSTRRTPVIDRWIDTLAKHWNIPDTRLITEIKYHGAYAKGLFNPEGMGYYSNFVEVRRSDVEYVYAAMAAPAVTHAIDALLQAINRDE